jgi:PAS domain S-box-containing protein
MKDWPIISAKPSNSDTFSKTASIQSISSKQKQFPKSPSPTNLTFDRTFIRRLIARVFDYTTYRHFHLEGFSMVEKTDNGNLNQDVKWVEQERRTEGEDIPLRRNKELELISRVSQTLNSILDMNQILAVVLNEVRCLLNVVGSSVWLVERESGDVVCRQASGIKVKKVRGYHLKLNEGIAGWVSATGQSVIVADTREDKRYHRGVDKIMGIELRSILSVPMQARGKIIGAIQVVDLQPDRFDTSHQKLLEALAAAAAIAVDNARLFEQMQWEITVRKGAEEALRENQNKYRDLLQKSERAEAVYQSLLNSSADAVAIFNLDEKVSYVSPSFTDLCGWQPEEIYGTDLQLITESDNDIYRHMLDNLIKAGIPFRGFETKCLTKRGRFIDVSISASRYDDHMGKPVGVLFLIRDISEGKKIREQLIRAQKMESIGTLAGGIAHDFNNILASMIGYTELSLDDAIKGTQLHNNLQEVMVACSRARELVHQILTFSRQTDHVMEAVVVKQVVREVLKLMRSVLPTTIEIRSNINCSAQVLGDPSHIHQILMNLCTNAAHAMEEHGGTLSVSLDEVLFDKEYISVYPEASEGLHVKISVQDTGSGITPEVLDSIFDPYFTTKEGEKGTGLGLAVVHGIIKSYRGQITVDSQTGKGTTFDVYLPVFEGHSVKESHQAINLPRGRERILFVDDDESVANAGKLRLERLGYHVEVRYDSIEALHLFRYDPYWFDLVITDMTMPKMTGDQLAEKLMEIRPTIPVIVCTGFSNSISEEKAVRMGIRALLYKPIELSEIAFKIRDVLVQ